MRQVTRRLNNCIEVFTQRSEQEARELFNRGYTVSLMAPGLEPNSSTSEVDYTKGEELFYDSSNVACVFDQVKEDFSKWLNSNGCKDYHGQIPVDAFKISCWTCQTVHS